MAEDDAALRSVLDRGLRESGYTVDAVADGAAALHYLRSYEYAAAVLDWRMPKLSGLEVVQALRLAGTHTPVLMLTARDTTSDRVTGLDAGADDYLVKPFEFAELQARLRALLRRPDAAIPPVLACGPLTVNLATREVTVDGRQVDLTTTEFGILELLLRRVPNVVERRTIAQQIWPEEADALGSNTIGVHVTRLRSKLAEGGGLIETVRGVGYRMTQG